MSILFERKVESGDDSVPEAAASDLVAMAADVPEASDPDTDLDALERIDQLEDEVDHLRACIDQILDMVDAQLDTTENVELIADRMSLFERRMQRVEDGQRASRRAGDQQ